MPAHIRNYISLNFFTVVLVKISLCLPGIALGQETLRLKQTTKIASDGKTTTRDFEYTSDGHIERIIESTNGSKTRVDHIIYDKTSVTTNIDDGADGTINRYQLEMLDKTDGRLLGFFLIDKDKQVLNVISENSFNESGLITGWELKRPNPDAEEHFLNTGTALIRATITYDDTLPSKMTMGRAVWQR